MDKTRVVHDFRAATSSNTLKTVACASCAENVCVRDALNNPVADLNLDILRNPPISSGQISMDPPLPYTEGPLAGILVNPTGIHHDEDGTRYLSLCPPCRSALSRRKLPRLALTNLNVIGAVPPELDSLILVEELKSIHFVGRFADGATYRSSLVILGSHWSQVSFVAMCRNSAKYLEAVI